MPPSKSIAICGKFLAMIDAGRLSPREKDFARRIFTRLAEAEAKVHGAAIEEIHFHEVGAVDAIADVVGAVVGFDLLGVERIVASPVPTGWGSIKSRTASAVSRPPPRPNCSKAFPWPSRPSKAN